MLILGIFGAQDLKVSCVDLNRVQWLNNFSDVVAWHEKHEAHKFIRSEFNKFFSKEALSKLEDKIFVQIRKLSTRLKKFSNSGKPVSLSHAFSSFATGMT
jgi:hypothetical protein